LVSQPPLYKLQPLQNYLCFFLNVCLVSRTIRGLHHTFQKAFLQLYTFPIDKMTIPLTYRVTFIFLDIILPIFGVTMHITNAPFILTGFTPSPILPPSSETIVLLDTLAGWYAALAFLNIVFLMKRPNDIVVWRALGGATLLIDLFMLGAFGRELSGGRTWRGVSFSDGKAYGRKWLTKTG